MSESAKSNVKELSDTFVNETDKEKYSKQLNEIREIEGNKVMLAIKHNDMWYLAFGNYRISELFETYEEVVEESKILSWDRITAVAHIVFKNINKLEELEKMIDKE